MIIKPARRLRGECRVPGDKSISHRAAILAALANGTSRIKGFSNSRDCLATLSCLTSLGVSIGRSDGRIQIEGKGLSGLSQPGKPLDCENSGTTMRLLSGVLAAQNFSTTLTGDHSLGARPMTRIIEPLKRMGATIVSRDGRPPLVINGAGKLNPIKYEMPIPSAQVKSCLLLAGLYPEGPTEVVERAGPTRDHTEKMLRWFGANLKSGQDTSGQNKSTVVGPAKLLARDVAVPGDFSAAAFFIVAAMLLSGSKIEIHDVGINPTRTQLLDTLRAIGAQIEISAKAVVCDEPLATLRVRGTDFWNAREGLTLTISGSLTAALIDELPLLAVVGSKLPGRLIIQDARELRYKETDRIAATVKNLHAMGALVQEREDGLTIHGGTRLHGAELDSFGDHRIAMAFSIAALLAKGESEIKGSECVAVSFPNFFEVFESLVER